MHRTFEGPIAEVDRYGSGTLGRGNGLVWFPQDRQHIDEIDVDAPEPAWIVQRLDQPLGVTKMGECTPKFPQVK
jgi:hypothetical protein